MRWKSTSELSKSKRSCLATLHSALLATCLSHSAILLKILQAPDKRSGRSSFADLENPQVSLCISTVNRSRILAESDDKYWTIGFYGSGSRS